MSILERLYVYGDIKEAIKIKITQTAAGFAGSMQIQILSSNLQIC